MYVRELKDCNLMVIERAWPFAEDHATAIAQNWTAACARNPKLFDGDVFMVDQWSIDEGILAGQVLPAKFASYLYWRDFGMNCGCHFNEAFVTSVIVSSDGGILLAQAIAGTLNEGLFGSPGGLLDERDVGCDKRMDPAGAAVRELQEETGLAASEMVRQPGFLLAHVAPYLAIASVFRIPLPGLDLVERVAVFLKEQAEPELEAPRVIYKTTELDELPLTPFGRLLTTHVLGM